MKNLWILLLLCIITILSFIITSNCYAEKQLITLPGGQIFDISTLSQDEVKQLIKIAQKGQKNVADTSINDIAKTMSTINPENINSWRQLITGTIKDICDDLNVTVNEFIKTPVGVGIAALIVYKVAGKEFLSSMFDVVLMVPLWCIVTFLHGIILWYFYGNITLYNIYLVTDEDPNCIDWKKIKKESAKDTIQIKKMERREGRYDWNSKEARCGLAIAIGISQVIITIVALCIVFA